MTACAIVMLAHKNAVFRTIRFSLISSTLALFGGTMRLCWLLALSSLTLQWLFVCASVTNRTIDDTYGDSVTQLQVEYSGSDYWHAGQDCTVCAIHPDKNQTFAGTWHDTTTSRPDDDSPHSAALKFNGMPT